MNGQRKLTVLILAVCLLMVVTPVVSAEDETINPDPDQTITIPECTLKENPMTTQNHTISEIAYTEPGKDLTLSPSIDDSEFEVAFIDEGEPNQAFDDRIGYIQSTDSGHIVESDGNPGPHLFVLREGATDHDVLPVVISEYSIAAEHTPETVSPDEDDPLISVTVDNPDDEIDSVEIRAEFDGELVRSEADPIGNGTYQATIDIPENTPEGEYSIHATALGPNEFSGIEEYLGEDCDNDNIVSQEPLALSTVGSISVESTDDDDSGNGNGGIGDPDPGTGDDPPDVTITSPDSAAVNESILFSANITETDEDPEYEWTIGNQTYTDNVPNHTFTEPGDHQISLTATFEDTVVNDTTTITISDESSSDDEDENGSGPQQPDLDDGDGSDDPLAPSPLVIVAAFFGALLVLVYRTN